jgi:AmmeMemoRadiSam system protein B
MVGRIALVVALGGALVIGQAAPQAPRPVPTLEDVRKAMGIPSSGDVRGQQDVVGYASRPDQMAAIWDLAATAPAPESFGRAPQPGVLGAICPHDDYVYAGRVYRQILPLVTARTVVLVGVFHQFRRFGARNQLVFDPYRAWRSPDGEIPISSLRGELLSSLAPGDAVQNAAMHDVEHSLEAIAYWLKHARRDVEIVPVILPEASFERFQELAARLGAGLAKAMQARSWQLGRDVAIVISSDGVHYGSDFQYTPYGAGGIEAFTKAVARDRELMNGPLTGPVQPAKARAFFEACVDPANPSTYRMPWCGRFSIPFGLLLLQETAQRLGLSAPVGQPVALGVSVDTPELPVKPLGMGPTAPANLYHFVTHPAVAFTKVP